MTPEQRKIQELERQVKTLTERMSLLNGIFYNSSSTRLTLRGAIAFDKQAFVGFYGKDPVKQQTLASDTLANLLTALRTLGIIT